MMDPTGVPSHHSPQMGVRIRCALCRIATESAAVPTDGRSWDERWDEACEALWEKMKVLGWVLFAVGDGNVPKHYHLCPECADVATPAVRERLVSGWRKLGDVRMI